MPKLELLTSTSPAGFLDEVIRLVSEEPNAGWCIIVPRAHLARDITAALQQQGDEMAWVGNRVLTVDALLAHYARSLDAQPALTPLQVRQLINATVLELHEESGGAIYDGQIKDGRVSEATLRSLARLFAELEPFGWTPDDLQAQLAKGNAHSLRVQDRAWQVAQIYRRYTERLTASRYQGPLGQAVAAAEMARTAKPPEGVRRFLFLGLDTSGLKDVGVRAVHALAKNKSIERVIWALVLPEAQEAPGAAWSTHGNSHLFDHWASEHGERRHVRTTDQFAALPEDLAALISDPFAYRLEPVGHTGAVRAVRVPDTQLEVEWVAADIKRRILDDGVNPSQIAVIARNMDERAEDFERALEGRGVPVVSSREIPLHRVPAVSALLTLFRLPAFGWRVQDVVSAAESPYLATDIHPTLLARVGNTGPRPHSAEEWKRRIAALRRSATLAATQAERGANDLAQKHAQEAARLEERFDAFLNRVQSVLGDNTARTPADWVAALVGCIEQWELERRIYDVAPDISRAQRAVLARTDLDGLNALIRTAHDWQAGQEIAGVAEMPLDAQTWCAELEAIAAESHIRSSTFPREAVQLLLPAQASLREWDITYVVGLADGTFPVHTEITDHTLSEEERQALHLPTADQRAARERLLFHLAVATARKELILVTPAADERGKALVMSPFLSCLPLRVNGLRIEQVTAREMVPSRPEQVLSLSDVDLFAAERYRACVESAADEAELVQMVQADPVIAQWLSQSHTRRGAEGWAVERVREMADLLLAQAGEAPLQIPFGEFVGLIPRTRLPGWVKSDEAVFSPSELETYRQCNFRFFASRLLGLGYANDWEVDHNEAAAFGTLQHRVLERFYGELMSEGMLPPNGPADIEDALSRLEGIARASVREYMASAHEQLWSLDLDFIMEIMRDFVRRDLTRMLETEEDEQAGRVRTRLAAIEAQVGPVSAEVDGVRFRLHGKIDRVERIEDTRLPAAAQGWLHIVDYKSTRRAWGPKPDHYLSGKDIQLPLYAYMAEEHFGSKVFGIGELRTSLQQDPEPFTVRQIGLDQDGKVRLYPLAGIEGNPMAQAKSAALSVAAQTVRQIRGGRLAPQPKRQCFGCSFKNACRAATMADPAYFRSRAQMPLVVDAAAYADAEQRAKRESEEPTDPR